MATEGLKVSEEMKAIGDEFHAKIFRPGPGSAVPHTKIFGPGPGSADPKQNKAAEGRSSSPSPEKQEAKATQKLITDYFRPEPAAVPKKEVRYDINTYTPESNQPKGIPEKGSPANEEVRGNNDKKVHFNTASELFTKEVRNQLKDLLKGLEVYNEIPPPIAKLVDWDPSTDQKFRSWLGGAGCLIPPDLVVSEKTVSETIEWAKSLKEQADNAPPGQKPSDIQQRRSRALEKENLKAMLRENSQPKDTPESSQPKVRSSSPSPNEEVRGNNKRQVRFEASTLFTKEVRNQLNDLLNVVPYSWKNECPLIEKLTKEQGLDSDKSVVPGLPFVVPAKLLVSAKTVDETIEWAKSLKEDNLEAMRRAREESPTVYFKPGEFPGSAVPKTNKAAEGRSSSPSPEKPKVMGPGSAVPNQNKAAVGGSSSPSPNEEVGGNNERQDSFKASALFTEEVKNQLNVLLTGLRSKRTKRTPIPPPIAKLMVEQGQGQPSRDSVLKGLPFDVPENLLVSAETVDETIKWAKELQKESSEKAKVEAFQVLRDGRFKPEVVMPWVEPLKTVQNFFKKYF